MSEQDLHDYGIAYIAGQCQLVKDLWPVPWFVRTQTMFFRSVGTCLPQAGTDRGA
ncbi:MAG: hypothetical protein KAR17_11360 [Cyclobacteriaceae bacterium]|nr:hypothetical protein [Cyclobacteriaceae bacterium]